MHVLIYMCMSYTLVCVHKREKEIGEVGSQEGEEGRERGGEREREGEIR